jgi:sphinganine-1-phosphate aldolase
MGGVISALTKRVDGALHGLTPSQIIAMVIATYIAINTASSMTRSIARKGLKKTVFLAAFPLIKKLGAVQKEIKKQHAQVRKDFEHSLMKHTKHEAATIELPDKPIPQNDILVTLNKWKQFEDSLWKSKKVSGAVYYGDDSLSNFCGEVYKLFALSNPLHPDVFPYVRKMEAEVVAMCLKMFNGGADSCGVMTSGGTESIMLAMKAYRDYARYERGITHPELIVAKTAHAAFMKAGDAFGIEVIEIPVDQKTFRLTVDQVRPYVSSNTIAIVGSSPNYPQGIIDDIENLSEFARKKGIPFHTDCCLGSFLLPFAVKLGHQLPVFDFRNPGVTSISMDTHKYGYAPKGSSVVMYSRPEYRSYQYFTTPDWTGGIYATPGLPGSRAGSLIAVTWATMLSIGKEGYTESARAILDAAKAIREGVKPIDGIEVLGSPLLSVVSFGATKESKINIYGVADMMKERGWNLNSLQNPPSFHICCTYLHKGMADTFLKDLKESVDEVKADPQKTAGASSAMYGMAGSLPDASLVGDAAKIYMDVYYSLDHE